mgnify:CR=1 FL=1
MTKVRIYENFVKDGNYVSTDFVLVGTYDVIPFCLRLSEEERVCALTPLGRLRKIHYSESDVADINLKSVLLGGILCQELNQITTS